MTRKNKPDREEQERGIEKKSTSTPPVITKEKSPMNQKRNNKSEEEKPQDVAMSTLVDINPPPNENTSVPTTIQSKNRHRRKCVHRTVTHVRALR